MATSKLGQEVLTGAFSAEKPAAVDDAITLQRAGFELKYPGNWKIDTEDVDYEPDHNFMLESPGSAYASIAIYDIELDPKETVETMIDSSLKKVVMGARRSQFQQWGQYKGYGVELKGRIIGVARGGIRVFVHSKNGQSFSVIEQYMDDDVNRSKPGHQLLEKSFRLKQPGHAPIGAAKSPAAPRADPTALTR